MADVFNNFGKDYGIIEIIGFDGEFYFEKVRKLNT